MKKHSLALADTFRAKVYLAGKCYRVQFKVAYLTTCGARAALRITRSLGTFKEAIGQLVFERLDYSPKKLYQLGFPVSSIGEGIHFKILSSQKEYLDVLTLRKKAYSESTAISAFESMSDTFDADAIIVIALHQRRVVASLRILQSKGGIAGLEHSSMVDLRPLVSAEDRLLEITRVCTDADYRKGDLLASLFQFTARTAIGLDCTTIVGSATDDLLPLYLRLGFKKTTLRYCHPKLGSKQHSIICADQDQILRGRGVHPLCWSIIYAGIYRYGLSVGLLTRPRSSDAIRLKLFGFIAFFSQFATTLARRRYLRKFAI